MFKNVLVAVDVSVADDTQTLLAATKRLTQPWDSTLHVVTVIPSVGMPIVGSYFDANFEEASRKAVSEQLTTAIENAQLNATAHILSGTVYDRVIEHAAALDIDLIVIGAHQPEMRDYLLGSNAARVVRHSGQSVLVLRD